MQTNEALGLPWEKNNPIGQPEELKYPVRVPATPTWRFKEDISEMAKRFFGDARKENKMGQDWGGGAIECTHCQHGPFFSWRVGHVKIILTFEGGGVSIDKDTNDSLMIHKATLLRWSSAAWKKTPAHLDVHVMWTKYKQKRWIQFLIYLMNCCSLSLWMTWEQLRFCFAPR